MLGKIINVELIKHPYNWVVVFVMCIFALVFLGMVFPVATPPAADA